LSDQVSVGSALEELCTWHCHCQCTHAENASCGIIIL